MAAVAMEVAIHTTVDMAAMIIHIILREVACFPEAYMDAAICLPIRLTTTPWWVATCPCMAAMETEFTQKLTMLALSRICKLKKKNMINSILCLAPCLLVCLSLLQMATRSMIDSKAQKRRLHAAHTPYLISYISFQLYIISQTFFFLFLFFDRKNHYISGIIHRCCYFVFLNLLAMPTNTKNILGTVR
ncbi:hypothetical protein BC943DRAFT_206380 [Umbelopsis sp. AD052]|nr:hypothetical protein BC943DRAFT_206380 [Umbelopsis sp. AD052]